MAKNEFAGQLLWIAANTCVRTSVLLLYTTVFNIKSFKLIANIVFGLNTAFALAVVLQTFLICQPLEFNWNRAAPGGSCGNQMGANMAIGIINIIIDVIIVCLPMPLVWSLKMAKGKKVALSLIFGMGIL